MQQCASLLRHPLACALYFFFLCTLSVTGAPLVVECVRWTGMRVRQTVVGILHAAVVQGLLVEKPGGDPAHHGRLSHLLKAILKLYVVWCPLCVALCGGSFGRA
jgi:hypothetical protein